jgi:hypothetical protein
MLGVVNPDGTGKGIALSRCIRQTTTDDGDAKTSLPSSLAVFAAGAALNREKDRFRNKLDAHQEGVLTTIRFSE